MFQLHFHHAQIANRTVEDRVRLTKTRRRHPLELRRTGNAGYSARRLIGFIRGDASEIVLKGAGGWRRLISDQGGRRRRRIVLGPRVVQAKSQD
jgi:hypothetical protein